MSRNETVAAVPLEVMWAVLADPRQYGRFVVGTKRVRRFDPGWPEAGAAVHHSIGLGPLHLRDATHVVDVRPTTHLRLHAGLGPLGVSEIVLTLEAVSADRTRLVIEEHGVHGTLRTLWNPALDRLMWLRNVELVRRFRRIAEQRGATIRTVAEAQGRREQQAAADADDTR